MEQTEEQRKRAFEDAGMPVIGADTLETAPTPIEPTEPVYSSVSTLPEYKPMELTEPEKEVSAAQKKIAELRGDTLGESELRTSLEEKQDIEAKRQTITDLEAEYGIIQAEARELAEQQRVIPLQLQEEFKGRGVTAGGLRPLETGRLRQLAIRQGMVTSKGMFAIANLQAAQGNLNTALGLIDRAVSVKFDPIKEKLRVETENLQLLLQSPELSLADRNRANSMLTQKEQEMAEVEAQQAESKRKGELVVEVASLGADALLLREINQAKTYQEALEIVADSGIRIQGLTQLEKAKIASEEALAQQRLASAEKMRGGVVETIPTFDEFVDEILQTPEGQSIIKNYEEQVKQTLMSNQKREVIANAVQDLYNQAVGATTSKEKFSSTEKKKLEQAGLSKATRQEQLDFLFGRTTGTGEFEYDNL